MQRLQVTSGFNFSLFHKQDSVTLKSSHIGKADKKHTNVNITKTCMDIFDHLIMNYLFHCNQKASLVWFKPGDMTLTGSDMCLPALLGMEYPDPIGSGLSVPVLGCQSDLISGITIPLAGTMQDPDGKGTMKNKLLLTLT